MKKVLAGFLAVIFIVSAFAIPCLAVTINHSTITTTTYSGSYPAIFGTYTGYKSIASLPGVTIDIEDIIDPTLSIEGKAADAAVVGAKFAELMNEELNFDQTVPPEDMTHLVGKNINSKYNLTDNDLYSCVYFQAPATATYRITPSSTSQFRYFVYSAPDFVSANFLRTATDREYYLHEGEWLIARAKKTNLSLVVEYSTTATVSLKPELPLSETQAEQVSAQVNGILDDLLDDGYMQLKGKWSRNGWLSFNSKDNRAFRVRFEDAVVFDRDVVLVSDDGYRIGIYYEQGGSETSRVISLPANTVCKIYIRRQTEDSSEVADVDEFANALHVSTRIADIERYSDTFTDISMFARVGIIGDSYASGGGIISGIRQLTWGKNLERQAGVAVDIYARSGESIVGWVTDETRGLPALLAGEQCGLYWFQHGINGTSTPEGLGTPADMSTVPHPQTFYGQYVEAIEQVKAAFPQSRIVLATVTGSAYSLYSTLYAEANDAIRRIADYCEVPLVDIADDDYLKSTFYSDNNRSAHPTAITAAGLASAYRRLLSRCIQANPDYFREYGLTVKTRSDEIDERMAAMEAAIAENRERYSVGEELLIGEWIEGGVTYDLFRKTIDCGALTNATQKQVEHGITAPYTITRVSGMARSESTNLPLPFAAVEAQYNIYLAVGSSEITITPGSDRSDFTATVIIEYYKPRT